jgi:death on curing protein
MELVFLTLVEVLEIHENQIDLYGGKSGVRDLGLLSSALAAPESSFDGNYLHGDIFDMAAAYLFHIVRNHPFIDGNKRTGAVTALVFLYFNNVELEIDEDEFANAVIAVASGAWDKTRIADFLRSAASSQT